MCGLQGRAIRRLFRMTDYQSVGWCSDDDALNANLIGLLHRLGKIVGRLHAIPQILPARPEKNCEWPPFLPIHSLIFGNLP